MLCRVIDTFVVVTKNDDFYNTVTMYFETEKGSLKKIIFVATDDVQVMYVTYNQGRLTFVVVLFKN